VMILPVARTTAGKDQVFFLIGDFIAQEIRRRIGLLFKGCEVPFQFVGKNFYERRLGMKNGAAKEGGERKDNCSAHLPIRITGRPLRPVLR
jgi:hypothetical protein